MGAICLTEYGEPKRGNERGVETQEVKGCSFKMVRKAQNQGGSRRPKRKYEILVAYPDSYKERSTTRRVKLGGSTTRSALHGEDAMCRQMAFNISRCSKLLANT